MAELPDLHVKVIPDMSEVDKAIGAQKPSVGRIVHYTIGEGDAEQIKRRYADATRNMSQHRQRGDGSQIHAGNSVQAGDVLPAVIVRVWSVENGCSNLQVFLDGNDTYWATSRVQDDPETIADRYSPSPDHAGPGHQGGTWHWPERA
jgi:hypothetical protein